MFMFFDMAEKVARGAKSAGADVETIFLQGMKIAPCNACCQRQVETDLKC